MNHKLFLQLFKLVRSLVLVTVDTEDWPELIEGVCNGV